MSKVAAAAGAYRLIWRHVAWRTGGHDRHGLGLGGWVRAFTNTMAAALPNAAGCLATLKQAYPNISVPVRAAGKSQGDLA